MTHPNTPAAASRRAFLARSGGCAAAALLGIPAISGLAQAVRGPDVPDMPARLLSRRVWGVIAREALPTNENLGFFSNAYFIVARQGVVVFDTGSSVQIGEMILRQIRRVTPKPVIAVINSHWHGDHWMGNQAFVDASGKDLPIYALAGCTEGIRGALGQEWVQRMVSWTQGAISGTQPVIPNRTLAHDQVLDFGDLKLRAHHYATAHTPFDLSIEVLGDDATLIGDVAANRRISNMEDGSYEGSLTYFERIAANTRTRLWCSGHGEPSTDQLAWNQTLFKGIWDSAQQAAKDSAGPEAAKALALDNPDVRKAMPGTIGFAANIGKFCSIAYLEAEKKLF